MGSETLWLIRKRDTQEGAIAVLGPVPKSELERMIEAGELHGDDEVCAENSYWFSLFEDAEVKRFLKTDPSKISGSYPENEKDNESTQPDILLDDFRGVRTEDTTTIIRPTPAKSMPGRSTSSILTSAGSTQAGGSSSTRAKPALEPHPTPGVESRFQLERGQVFGVLSFLGTLGVLGAVYWLIRILRSGG